MWCVLVGSAGEWFDFAGGAGVNVVVNRGRKRDGDWWSAGITALKSLNSSAWVLIDDCSNSIDVLPDFVLPSSCAQAKSA
ncbi:hypothetical protein, partial [Burkholderia oklahomensis]|uniref:hypothetical protein n=1 Tax=Burkholderia oklahomensis TaxID=342113 RepID=UPI001E5B1A6C